MWSSAIIATIISLCHIIRNFIYAQYKPLQCRWRQGYIGESDVTSIRHQHTSPKSYSVLVDLIKLKSHLQIYSKPSQQRLIVRISCVIPIYGLTAALSFQFPAAILYFAAVRDIAEAFVIYSFLNLLYVMAS